MVARIGALVLASSVLALACMPGASSSPSPDPDPSPVTLAGDQQQRSATALYDQNCGKCHGANGQGGGGGTKSLLNRDKFDQKWDKPFFDAIKNGVPDMGMEAYGETMSDEQIWALVVHLREMQAQALRSQYGSPKATNGVYTSQRHQFKMETVVEAGKGLQTPWALDWLPDGRMLVTNRPGQMFLAVKGELTEIEGMPPVVELGQGGLMEVAVHPDYKSNGWIYLALTDPAKNGRGGMTKIVRGKLTFPDGKPTWGSQQTIFESDQSFYNGAGIHFGSRIVFDGKGHIFFVVGERGGNMKAQQIDNPYGKIYRLNDDGTAPSDNPYAKDAGSGTKSHVAGIWTLGHRNPQGLVMDLKGELWDTEHGPRGGDEVNRIKKGANYGWPVIAHSINYSDSPFRTPWPKAGENFTLPVFRWLPSIGACGLDVARGDAFPEWKGDLLAGGLVGENLDRIRVDGDKLIEREELIHGHGRIRDVSVGPDGYVYIALNGPDKVVRLVPVK